MSNSSNDKRKRDLFFQVGEQAYGGGRNYSRYQPFSSWKSGNAQDHKKRVKLSLPPKTKNLFYDGATEYDRWLLEPLKKVNGVIFPFVPQIIVNNSANYSAQSPAHTNYPYQVYQNSTIGTINLFGQFSAQTQEEAKYVRAVILFMRLVTKSFRNNDPNAGNPPIILRLTGHGNNLLPNAPVVIQSFDLTLPNSVDYITVADTEKDRIPTMTDISITMTPIYSRSDLTTFSMDDIANGNNLKGFM